MYALSIALVPFLGFSQTFEGTIVDMESKDVMSNAIITIDGTSLLETTNEVGKFSFSKTLPKGEQVVIVTKKGYEDKYFLIDVNDGKKVTVDEVGIEMTKDEKKRRKKLRKAKEKEEKEKREAEEDRLKEARKKKEKEEKRLAKERKRAKKNSKDLDVIYEETEPSVVESPVNLTVETPMVEEVLPIQVKYGALIGVTPEEITNIPLYQFIDEWMGTTYKMGGANREGIDCSSFAQRLFTSVYGMYIERTAEKQFMSKYTDKFKGKEFLQEGDLLFFKSVTDGFEKIGHVGIYLGNNMFINATSRRGTSGVSGVKISNLSEGFWTSRFVSAGRRINNN